MDIFSVENPANTYTDANTCRCCGSHVADPHAPHCPLIDAIDTPPTLYFDLQGGLIACINHVGMYGKRAIEANPTAGQWTTPLNVWARVTDADREAWHEDTMRCESCPRVP